MRMWFAMLVVAAVTLALGSVLAARLWNASVAHNRQEAIERITAAALGKVTRRTTSAERALVTVNLFGCPKLTTSLLTDLSQLPTLRELNLSNTRIGDAELAYLDGMTRLEVLYLGSTQISDAGVDHLLNLKRLQTLNLGDTAITDAALAKLRALPELHELYVGSTDVSDAGLAYLKDMAKLRFVHLSGTRVTESGRQALQKALPALEIN